MNSAVSSNQPSAVATPRPDSMPDESPRPSTIFKRLTQPIPSLPTIRQPSVFANGGDFDIWLEFYDCLKNACDYRKPINKSETVHKGNPVSVENRILST